VPKLLEAAYLVPTALDATEAGNRARAALTIWLPGRAGDVAGKVLDARITRVTSMPAAAMPPILAGFQEQLGVAPELFEPVTAADMFAMFSATLPPGWPPARPCPPREPGSWRTPAAGRPVPGQVRAHHARGNRVVDIRDLLG
jgi:hypothetical protein